MMASILVSFLLVPIWLGYFMATLFIPVVMIFALIVGVLFMITAPIYFLLRSAAPYLGSLDPQVLSIPIHDLKVPLVNFSKLFPDLFPKFIFNPAYNLEYAQAEHTYGRVEVGDMLTRAQATLPNNFNFRLTKCFDQTSDDYNTGGAIDVSMVDNKGKSIDISEDTKNTSAKELFENALVAVGFVHNPQGTKQWSYGDQYWAYSTSAVAGAIFGPILLTT